MKKLACLFLVGAIAVCCGCELSSLVDRVDVFAGSTFGDWLANVASVGETCRQAIHDAWTAAQ